MRKWLAAAMSVALLSGCSTLAIRYEMGLDEVERPAVAKQRYGEPRMTKRQEDGTTEYVFEDQLIRSVWRPNNDDVSFRIENKTSSSIKVVWDEAAFVDVDGVSHRVVHKGVRLLERGASQPPSVIVRKSALDDLVIPADNIQWGEKAWSQSKLLPQPSLRNGMQQDYGAVFAEKYKGKRFQVLLPLVVDGVTNEYIFSFKITNAEFIEAAPMEGNTPPRN